MNFIRYVKECKPEDRVRNEIIREESEIAFLNHKISEYRTACRQNEHATGMHRERAFSKTWKSWVQLIDRVRGDIMG